MIDACRVIRREFELPEGCWSASRRQKGWTPSGNSQQFRKLWPPSICPPLADTPRTCFTTTFERSKSSLVHYLALEHIYEELTGGGVAIPSSLRRWRAETAGGRRGRPPRMAAPAHRPIDPAYIWRDVSIQFAIEVLSRVRIQPQGKDVSGCAIVWEALYIPEDTVKRIWKNRIWKKPIWPWVRRHADAISKRVRPYRSPEA